ncbi:hypothetical protein SLEP1_g11315 [Rubroshorea leprosula]|uniref:NAD(P)H dehydrogenase (quinone) n=2 Tax=Rubroshorea leprosula TaxID=152421 RepID=A0AAV5IK65_9ROSI|nr:hypothetical protein SLEP1_g11315 [Rubroshorea leprosula]
MGSEAGASKPVIKVAAICGSLRKGSFNRGLIRSAIQISKESINGMQIEYVDISPLPMLNTDLEVDGKYPAAVEAFRQKILEADAFLFASPEYNYSVTGPLKNAIDWASRSPNVWADKAAAIVSAAGSLGGARAQYHLRQIGVYLDLHFINKPEFFLNAFESPAKFDTDGNLIDSASRDRLKALLLALQAFTLRLQGCSLHLPTMSESLIQSCGGTEEEGPVVKAHTKENAGEGFHAWANFRLGTTSESADWYNFKRFNQGRRAVKQLEDRYWKLRERERVYKLSLVGTWVLVIVLMLFFWVMNDGNVCCRRNFYYHSSI